MLPLPSRTGWWVAGSAGLDSRIWAVASPSSWVVGPEVVDAGELLELQPGPVERQVELDRRAQFEPGLAADFAAVGAGVDPRDRDDVRPGRVHFEPGRQGLDRLRRTRPRSTARLPTTRPSRSPRYRPRRAELAGDAVPRHARLHGRVAEGDGAVPVDGRQGGPRRRGRAGRHLAGRPSAARRADRGWFFGWSSITSRLAWMRDRPLRLQPEAGRPQPAGQGGQELAVERHWGQLQVVQVGPEAARRRQQARGHSAA